MIQIGWGDVQAPRHRTPVPIPIFYRLYRKYRSTIIETQRESLSDNNMPCAKTGLNRINNFFSTHIHNKRLSNFRLYTANIGQYVCYLNEIERAFFSNNNNVSLCIKCIYDILINLRDKLS